MKSISIVSGFCALLCSVTHGMEIPKEMQDVSGKITVFDTTNQGVQLGRSLSKEQKQTEDVVRMSIETLWKTIPVQKSSLRDCDAMPKVIEVDASFKGIAYKFYMTHYNDRKFGEMSDIADFKVFYGRHSVGTFYSLSTSAVFKIINSSKDKKSSYEPIFSEKNQRDWDYFGSDRCSHHRCMGRPY